MALVGSDITVNAVVIKENDYSVLAKTKSGYELIIYKKDINTIRPKVQISGKDHRKGN